MQHRPADRLSSPADSRRELSELRGSYPSRRWLKTCECRYLCTPDQPFRDPDVTQVSEKMSQYIVWVGWRIFYISCTNIGYTDNAALRLQFPRAASAPIPQIPLEPGAERPYGYIIK